MDIRNKNNLVLLLVWLDRLILTKVKGVASSSLSENVRLINKTAALLKQQYNWSLIVCLNHEGFAERNCLVADDIGFANLLTNVE